MKIKTMLIQVISFFCFTAQPFAQTDAEKQQWLGYFEDSYIDCRTDFRAVSKNLKANYIGVEIGKIEVPSKKDQDLTVDYCYIPAQKQNRRLLIISTGIHGIEGYVGNAVVNLLVDDFIDGAFLAETGVLLIHGLNPYGFKNTRRVSENNIDLNRNSSVDQDLYQTVNAGYKDVYGLLNPSGKTNSRSLYNRFFVIPAVKEILKAGMPSLRQAVLQGQYEFAEGLYFGGKQQEPQIAAIGPVIQKYANPYPVLFNIDMHTGYGERGKLHLFPNPIDDPKLRASTEQLFDAYSIDWGDSGDFYTITGDFSGYITQLNPGKDHIPMTFEYGTLDSQKTMGSIRSIHNMILENQGNHHGYKKSKDQAKVEKRFREMYYPSDPEWRIKIMQQTKAVLSVVLENYVNGDF